MTKYEKKDIKGTIIRIIFIIWFISSIIGMIVLSKINGYYCIMIFGQYFLVFGSIIFISSKKKEKLVVLPFILVGLSCIIIPYLMIHPELLSKEVNWDKVILIMILLGFNIAGLCTIIIPLNLHKRLKKLCTITISAKIINYDTSYNDGTTTYCPIYEFEFNNTKYKVSNNIYTNIGVKPVNSIVELKINPNNPNEFIDNTTSLKFFMILGILVLAISFSALIYVILHYR